MEKSKLASAIVEREARLRGNRSMTEAIWQEIADFAMPDRAQFTVRITEGLERHRDLLDSTTARALEMFASYLHTTLNNPAAQWVDVEAVNVPQHRANDVAFNRALEDVGREVQSFIAAPGGNLYGALHTSYMDIGAFGNGVLHAEPRNNEFQVNPHHLGDVVFEEDAWRRPSAVFAKYHWTPDQIAARFGEDAILRPGESLTPEQLRKRRLQTDTMCAIHAVFPSSPAIYALATHLPEAGRLLRFASVWVNAEHRTVLRVDPERTQPYIVSRWLRTSGPSPYARGPGHTALPDARMVNRLAAGIVRGTERLVEPPFAVRDGSLVSPLRLFPSGVTHYEGDGKPESLLPPGASRVDIGTDLLAAKQQAIREAFFTPLFMSPDSPVRSATEILQQSDERNRAIAPMLTRVQLELHTALVERGLDIAAQLGRLPQVPSILEGVDIRIAYRSPLQASQRQIEALGSARLFEGLAMWGQVDPSVFDRYDMDKVSEALHLGSGAPMRIVRSDSEVRAIRRARAEAAQQQAAMAQAQQAAQAAASAGQAVQAVGNAAK